MPFFVLGELAESLRCRGQLNRCSLVWGAGTLRRLWLKLWESWNFAPSPITGMCQAHHHMLLNVCIIAPVPICTGVWGICQTNHERWTWQPFFSDRNWTMTPVNAHFSVPAIFFWWGNSFWKKNCSQKASSHQPLFLLCFNQSSFTSLDFFTVNYLLKNVLFKKKKLLFT